MIAFQKTAAGTIRDHLQSVIRIHEEHGFAVLAAGTGHDGRQLAEEICSEFERQLLRYLPTTRPANASARLETIFCDLDKFRTTLQIQFPGCYSGKVDLSAVWTVRGKLFFASLGSWGILAQTGTATHAMLPGGLRSLAALSGVGDGPQIEPTARKPIIKGPFNLAPGDWTAVFSEGILLSMPMDEIIPLAGAIGKEPDEQLERIFQTASNRFDGEDRTVLMMRFMPADTSKPEFKEVVLSEDHPRKFSMPLWLPLTIFLAILAFLPRVMSLLGDDED